MGKKNTLVEYFRLIRFSTVGNEAGVILLGAFIMGQRDIFYLTLLFIMGLFGHIFGYVLNEYVDVEVDKGLKYNIKKPLVSGAIPKKHALIIAILGCICTYILAFIYFPYALSILFLTVAAILTIIYDVYGKKIPFSDFVVAGTLGIFILFGASTLNKPLPYVVYLTSLIFFFDVVFMNFVQGGIKDIDHDFKAGAKTMALRMGVRVDDKKLFISNSFKIFACGLRIIYFALIFLLGLQAEIDLWLSSLSVIYVVVILLVIVVAISSLKLLYFKIFDKSKLYKLFTVINSSSVALLLVVLYPLLGLWVTLFLLMLPITWFVVFNTVLYGKPFQPLV